MCVFLEIKEVEKDMTLAVSGEEFTVELAEDLGDVRALKAGQARASSKEITLNPSYCWGFTN